MHWHTALGGAEERCPRQRGAAAFAAIDAGVGRGLAAWFRRRHSSASRSVQWVRDFGADEINLGRPELAHVTQTAAEGKDD